MGIFHVVKVPVNSLDDTLLVWKSAKVAKATKKCMDSPCGPKLTFLFEDTIDHHSYTHNLKNCNILIVLFFIATDNLRLNPPEVRVTSGQKPSTKIIYIALQTSVGLF